MTAKDLIEKYENNRDKYIGAITSLELQNNKESYFEAELNNESRRRFNARLILVNQFIADLKELDK